MFHLIGTPFWITLCAVRKVIRSDIFRVDKTARCPYDYFRVDGMPNVCAIHKKNLKLTNLETCVTKLNLRNNRGKHAACRPRRHPLPFSKFLSLNAQWKSHYVIKDYLGKRIMTSEIYVDFIKKRTRLWGVISTKETPVFVDETLSTLRFPQINGLTNHNDIRVLFRWAGA